MYRQKCSRDESANLNPDDSSPSHRKRYSSRTMSMPGNAADYEEIRNEVMAVVSEQQKSPESEDGKEERQRLNCKNAIHLAVPMSKKYNGDKPSSSSTCTPHVIALVGLPARGKTYISKKLSRYLNWIGVNTKVFNLGDYRRKMENKYSSHEIFNPENEEGLAFREKICEKGLQDVLEWLSSSAGEVAVFDATNTTRDRRKYLYQRVVKEKGFKLFFVESICNDKDIITSNILEVKADSPDYKDFDKEQVLTDFNKRIKHYEKRYETIDEDLEPDLRYSRFFHIL